MGQSSEPILILYKMSLLGIDISITSAVVVVWLASLLAFLVSFLSVRRASVVPGKLQSLFEIIYDFWHDQTDELFGDESHIWLPFVYALFILILVSNLLGMVPGVYPVSANINLTATLAVIVFFVYHLAGIYKYGLLAYLKTLLPEDVPWLIWPLMLVLEIASHLARPFSLAVRLFANMTAGHVVGLTILSFIFVFKSYWLAGFPLLGKVAIGLFEIFIALIQAYVFAYLSALYIGMSLSGETESE